jgi:hypothetical protein
MVKLVLVKWKDAHVPTGSWTHIDDSKDDGPYHVNTIGFLLDLKTGGKKGHLSIVQSWGQDDYIDGILHIPIKMVQTILTLNEKENDVTPNDFQSTIHYLSRVTPRGDDDQQRLITLIDRLDNISRTLSEQETKLGLFMHGAQN